MNKKDREEVRQDYFSDKSALVSRLEDMQHEQRHLTDQLRLSFSIEAIWPDAFDHGSVRFSGTQTHMSGHGPNAGLAFTQAWFINRVGKRYLTVAELISFKPDAKIHDDFKTRGFIPLNNYQVLE